MEVISLVREPRPNSHEGSSSLGSEMREDTSDSRDREGEEEGTDEEERKEGDEEEEEDEGIALSGEDAVGAVEVVMVEEEGGSTWGRESESAVREENGEGLARSDSVEEMDDDEKEEDDDEAVILSPEVVTSDIVRRIKTRGTEREGRVNATQLLPASVCHSIRRYTVAQDIDEHTTSVLLLQYQVMQGDGGDDDVTTTMKAP
jgi:hypothetical protein